MGQVLHGSATTTEAIRPATQHGQESLMSLARRDGINQKTIARCRRRSLVANPRCCPSRTRRSSPSDPTTLLPLDGCLHALQATILHLTRSSLHRCPQRHASAVPCRRSRLPEVEGDKPVRRRVQGLPLGYLHREAIDRGELFHAHAFACAQNHIDHRLTRPRHPWANGQVERMNRTIKEATVRSPLQSVGKQAHPLQARPAPPNAEPNS